MICSLSNEHSSTRPRAVISTEEFLLLNDVRLGSRRVNTLQNAHMYSAVVIIITISSILKSCSLCQDVPKDNTFPGTDNCSPKPFLLQVQT